jgi:hypothetical protein
VKSGSDCVHLYLRLLPALRRNVLVHLHDVFLPDGYPRHWMEELGLAWNEQYLLHALLVENPRWRVLYASRWYESNRPELLVRLMHGRAATGGSSLWMERVGESPSSLGIDV